MKDSFAAISKEYVKGEYEVAQKSVFKILREEFYQGLEGKRILDVGNGGEPPQNLLGKEIKDIFFVGLDNSFSMIKKGNWSYFKIIGDGFRLPFKDKSFDVILLNGVIHHLGLLRGEDQNEKLKNFLSELKRVAREKVIVHEITVPGFFEWLEKGWVAIKGSMMEFVLSKKTLCAVLKSSSLKAEKWRSLSSADLSSPWHFPILLMRFPWFRLPALLNPIENQFFILRTD